MPGSMLWVETKPRAKQEAVPGVGTVLMVMSGAGARELQGNDEGNTNAGGWYSAKAVQFACFADCWMVL